MAHTTFHAMHKLSVLFIFIFASYFFYDAAVQAYDEDVVVKAAGKGYAPENFKGTKKGDELSKRAALADAYRNMVKKLYGSETMKEGDILVESVNGLVKGAKVTKEECNDSACTVEITLTANSIVTTYGKTLSENKTLSKKKGKDKKQDEALDDCKNMKTILQSELNNIKSENKLLKKQVAELNKKLKKQN